MYYVSMTDSFMSGWGLAAGKIAKLVIECGTLPQAMQIERAARRRPEMHSVSVSNALPRYPGRRYQVSIKSYDEMGGPWLE